MPDKLFKVNIYDVSVGDGQRLRQLPFEEAIERVSNNTIQDRVRYINMKERRLEHCDRRDDCYLLNFTTFNYSGPGRVRETTPAIPIGLQPDEYFSHQTAMLYNRDRSLALVEATRGGMGPGAISNYLEEFAGQATIYQLIPRLDNFASARARRYRQFRRVEMRVALGPVGHVDRDMGVGALEAFGSRYGARTVDVVMRVGRARRNKLSIEPVLGLLTDALRAHDEDRVETLKVYGRENEDEQLELIDLLQHRESRVRKLPIDGGSREVSHEIRWRALREIWREFVIDEPLV